MSAGEKQRIRQRLRRRLGRIAGDELRRAGERAGRVLEGLAPYARAGCIGIYAAIGAEIDLSGLVRRGLSAGKRFAYPSWDEAGPGYRFRAVEDLRQLERGRFGVPEPGPGCPTLAPGDLGLALVPGLAFDLSGRRLGRGRGFYDRLLAGAGGPRFGVAHACQLVERLPEDSWDQRMDGIATPDRWHPVAPLPGAAPCRR